MQHGQTQRWAGVIQYTRVGTQELVGRVGLARPVMLFWNDEGGMRSFEKSSFMNGAWWRISPEMRTTTYYILSRIILPIIPCIYFYSTTNILHTLLLCNM